MSKSLRGRLENELRTDADFLAFCLDVFPEVHRRFGQGMERRQKVNLLLELADEAGIEAKLVAWLASHGTPAGSSQTGASTTEATPLAPRRYGLPPLPSPLVAREEFDAAAAALRSSEHAPRPFVLLTGVPGMGKSTLACVVAQACLAEGAFPDGVYWLRVQSRTADDLMTEFADALGEDSRAPFQKLLGRLVSAVQHRRILLVLDDVREPELLSSLAGLVAELTVLATARHRHDAPFITTVIEVDRLLESQARDLVTRTLADRWHRSVEPSWVFWLCQRLGNHALALSLATNAMGRLRLSEKAFIRRLDREFLSTVDGNTADRSLEASLRLSWQTLTPLQKDVIVAIGQLAEAPVWEELLHHLIRKELREPLDRLVEASLIYRNDNGQFTVHPVIYQWCKAQGKGDINLVLWTSEW